MKSVVNVRTMGALGDGVADDSGAIQAALYKAEREVTIPAGTYRIGQTLKVPSRRIVTADAGARLIVTRNRPMRRGEFLISNEDPVNGNEEITIRGGVWDGGFGGEFIVKGDDLFDPDACSGSCMNFVNVRGLRLLDLTVANTVVYHIRMAKLDGFEIRNIGFRSDVLAHNQDGLHFGGEVYNGHVENIRALSRGQTNDDMIALNADDSLERLENRDLVRGPIENITFRNIVAEDCYTAIRMLSVTAPIRNIRIENVHCGCRAYAINMDSARYCRTPLFKENDYPRGVGRVEKIRIDNLQVFATTTNHPAPALIHLECGMDDFVITHFRRLMEKDVYPAKPTLLARNLVGQRLRISGAPLPVDTVLHEKAESLVVADRFDSATLTRAT